MNLDETRIAIRERPYVELLDLAVKIVRTHGRLLGMATLLGAAAPFAVNAWLLAGYDVEQGDVPWGLMALFVLLTVAEAPFAMAPVTLYLGQAMFNRKPNWRLIVRQALGSLGQLLLFQGILRPFYVFWPYVADVVLLERNPLRARAGAAQSTAQRCRALHGGEAANLAAYRLGALLVGMPFFVSLWATLALGRALLLSRWTLDPVLFTVYFPLVLWIAVAFFAVVRFLSYLNLRIRREGWEVELLLRAERARLLRRGV